MVQNKKEDILTIPQAAEFCTVDRVTMWRWIKAGNIKASVTPGGHHRIVKEDLGSFLADQGMYPLARRYFPKKKILIVDDEPEFCDVISQLLSRQDYETSIAKDGFAAGLQITQFKPDLIILDLVMPGMDGFEVCRLVKGTPGTSHILVLAVTGYDTKENRKQIMASGADGYLAKPIEKDVLLKNIKELLDLKSDRERTAVKQM